MCMSKSAILQKYQPVKNNLILILHDLQSQNNDNCLHQCDIVETADYLNLTQAQVIGVVNYYSMFTMKPRGKNIITVCDSMICNMKDDFAIVKKIKDELGIEIGETTVDNLFTLNSSQCLGRCYDAPVIAINNEYYGELTQKSVGELINSFRKIV
jgi:NADH-quinone oxidoreductase subunit E